MGASGVQRLTREAPADQRREFHERRRSHEPTKRRGEVPQRGAGLARGTHPSPRAAVGDDVRHSSEPPSTTGAATKTTTQRERGRLSTHISGRRGAPRAGPAFQTVRTRAWGELVPTFLQRVRVCFEVFNDLSWRRYRQSVCVQVRGGVNEKRVGWLACVWWGKFFVVQSPQVHGAGVRKN